MTLTRSVRQASLLFALSSLLQSGCTTPAPLPAPLATSNDAPTSVSSTSRRINTEREIVRQSGKESKAFSIRSLRLPDVPSTLKFSDDGSQLYVGFREESILWIIDVESPTTAREIELEQPVTGIYPRTNGRYLVVSDIPIDEYSGNRLASVDLQENTVMQHSTESSVYATDGTFVVLGETAPVLWLADPRRNSLVEVAFDLHDVGAPIDRRGPYLAAGPAHKLDWSDSGNTLVAVHVPGASATVSLLSPDGELLGEISEVVDIGTLAARTMVNSGEYDIDYNELLITVSVVGNLALRALVEEPFGLSDLMKQAIPKTMKGGIERNIQIDTLDEQPIPVQIRTDDTDYFLPAVQLLTNSQNRKIFIAPRGDSKIAVFDVVAPDGNAGHTLGPAGILRFPRPVGAASLTRDGTLLAIAANRSPIIMLMDVESAE